MTKKTLLLTSIAMAMMALATPAFADFSNNSTGYTTGAPVLAPTSFTLDNIAGDTNLEEKTFNIATGVGATYKLTFQFAFSGSGVGSVVVSFGNGSQSFESDTALNSTYVFYEIAPANFTDFKFVYSSTGSGSVSVTNVAVYTDTPIP